MTTCVLEKPITINTQNSVRKCGIYKYNAMKSEKKEKKITDKWMKVCYGIKW